MKKLNVLFALIVIATLSFSCKSDKKSEVKKENDIDLYHSL